MPARNTRKGALTAQKGLTEAIAAKSRERRSVLLAATEIGVDAPHTPRNDLAPLLTIVMMPIERLKPAARQVRRRDSAQSARLGASVDRFGVCRPILIAADGTIVEGHGIWEVAKQKCIPEIPCIVVDHLTATEQRLLRLALNRTGETGAWDVKALQVEFKELTLIGEDLVVTGFELAEIDAVLLEDGDPADEFEVNPKPPTLNVSTSKLGDVWVLGEHRLIQGDAREESVYARLLIVGEMAALVLTDEPFNVPNLGHVTGNADHREFAMANGEMTHEQYAQFNRAWMSAAAAHLSDGALLASFIDWRSVEIILQAGRELGFSLLNIVVWVKTNGGQGSLWRSQHELLPVFKIGEASHINNVALGRHGRWRSNAWVCPGASSLGSDAREGLDSHPTVKPRALFGGRAARYHPPRRHRHRLFRRLGNDAVGRREGRRRCRAIEIDGPYCDLINRRWEATTGREAVLEATGESRSPTAASRRASRTEKRRTTTS